ncbi:Hpt domain-containing protein [Bradyrhizobium prioriisuperbiae]|uniref:Hpt domain-containing protein n=1 Tax=Bradyrhizobium prioriisuperbiae TaxID=2854389 RepID=UPI0028E9B171|nr:Hpt domain-containing protein [Bradyrhizobium prioritasuperba]
MAADKQPALKVETFADYQVITPPNPLRAAVRRVADDDKDDPVARAEQALADLSGEFNDWMATECERLAAAHAAIVKNGFTPQAREEFFRAAHDVKGHAATFGYPIAAAAAESLSRIIEHAPSLDQVPTDLLAYHVSAIQAIVREHKRIDKLGMADELSRKLRGMADKYLVTVNQDRPEHLEAILAPSIAPND